VVSSFILGDEKLQLLKKLNDHSRVLIPDGNQKHRKTVFKYFNDLMYPKKHQIAGKQEIKNAKKLS